MMQGKIGAVDRSLLSAPVIHDHQALVHEILKKTQDFDLGLLSRNLVIVSDMFDDVRNFAGLLQKVPDRSADIVHPEILASLQFENDSFASKSGVYLVRGHAHNIVFCDHHAILRYESQDAKGYD